MCHAVFSAEKAIGLLGLEMHTRRRNRANGVITSAEGGCLHIRIVESYGNCPQVHPGTAAHPQHASYLTLAIKYHPQTQRCIVNWYHVEKNARS